MSIEVVPTNAGLGAQIKRVDLAKPMDDELFAEIEATLDEHGVIVLRDQEITPEQQVAFSARFGEVAVNHNAKDFGIDGSPEIYLISNITKEGRLIGTPRAGSEWHTDMSYAKVPARATMLHAIEVPELDGLSLGDTEFANTAAAWDALPPALQEKLAGLTGTFDFRGRKRGRPISEETIAQYPPVEHPIVRTHPRTGRKGLYVMRNDCTGIVGMNVEEAQLLIDVLAEHIIRPEFVYRHRWCVGDVVVWDNCTAQHKAMIDYDLPQRRLMWRTTVKGSVPF